MEQIKKTKTGLKLLADDEYVPSVRGNILAKMTNTGNGFIFKFPEYLTTTGQDNYICMDYVEADYIRQLLNHYEESKDGS